jgi:hypothetical protein
MNSFASRESLRKLGLSFAVVGLALFVGCIIAYLATESSIIADVSLAGFFLHVAGLALSVIFADDNSWIRSD